MKSGWLVGQLSWVKRTGSGWLKVLDKSIASSLVKFSDHFWSTASSLLSVEGLETLASNTCLLTFLPLSFEYSGILCIFLFLTFLLLDSSEVFVFLSFTTGVLLASSEFNLVCLSLPQALTLKLDQQGCYS